VESMLGRPLEVEVRDNLEKAMKILKQKMSKEGILQEVKRRRFYEKPSVKRKRKIREARKRRRRELKRRGGGGGGGGGGAERTGAERPGQGTGTGPSRD
jgi:small subunit ribosomal protein S21